MREIEFRGKLINSDKWAYGNLDIKKTGTAIITPDETVLGTYGKVNPETIGQYTGLKDKNGKKIFEGDIVKVIDEEYKLEHVGVVKFNEGGFEFEMFKGDYERLTIPISSWLDEEKEIIGNVWDNPELLKEEI